MMVNTDNLVAMTEANQNFSKVARQAEKEGEVYIFKNNKPKYKLVDLENDTSIVMDEEEKINFVAMRVLKKYRVAFEELAKW